ncbi:hypothetical protein SAMN05216548_114109 [Faunimonas pinastri]|uniref:Uncharacterized protein n=1 Tax=Faunimonas pinastri TaxID=1855383 RepID=A0A1H9MYW6_9HYPH|nr:hypothetical protein [Faunimonas pinastri]SER28761.1 hypothetical protein SAMN05216548_114109 [Faunimonas pinastri]
MSESEPTKFKVRNYIDAGQLKADMSYSLADLSSAMMNQGALLVHYGILASKASRQVDSLKMLLENAEAQVYRALRDAALKTGEKITEAALEKKVAVHSQVVSLKRCLNEAKQIEAIAKIAVEGFRHRRDMLIQQGLISREEMKGEISISRRNEAENALEAVKERTLKRITGENATH